MSDIQFKKHRVFRETEDVIFYDISVDESNAADLVVHTGAAISPPDDAVGAKQFYIHEYQDDYNRVVSGERTFELVNNTCLLYTSPSPRDTDKSRMPSSA